MITTRLETNKKNTPLVFKRPISSSNSDIFALDKKAAFQKAVNEKNPLALATFEEQGASTQAKLLRLYNNPDYQKLSPQGRVRLRARIYNEYVVPSFTAKGIPPPDIKTWLHGTTKETRGNINPEDYFRSPSMQAAKDIAYHMADRASKIGIFGIELTHKAMMAQYGMDNLLFHTAAPGVDMDKFFPDKNKDIVINKVLKNTKQALGMELHNTNFFIANHPREGFLASAPGWTGEQVVMLPFYEAAAAGLKAASAITEGSVGLGTASGPAAKGIQNLSKSLATSPVGKFVGNRIYSAASFFLGSIAAGDTKEEAAKNAAGNVILETTAIPIGKAIASNPLIKKWTANILAMGGRPLAEELAKTATHEATFGRLDHDGISTNTAFNGRVVETRGAKEGGFRPGYFTHDGVKYEYRTPQERLAAYESVEQKLLAHRKVDDPVFHSAMEAEKLSVEAIALRNFGKPLAKMTPDEINQVLQRRLELIKEAEYELPAHVGDLNKADIKADVEKQAVESPFFGQFKSEMDKLGFPATEEVVNEDQIDAIQKQTGITSNSGALSKVDRIRARVQRTDGELLAAKMSLPDHERKALATVEKEQIERLRDKGYTELEARNKVNRNFNKNYERALQKLQDAQATVDSMAEGAHPSYDKMSREVGSDGKTNLERAKELAKTDKSRPPEGFLPHTQEEKDAIESSLGRPYNPKTDSGMLRRHYKIESKKEITEGSASLSPEDFSKNRRETVSYLKNPNYERRAADGTRVGRRDKRPWNVRLRANNLAEFIDYLKEADGGMINFENPYHQMLYHYANRDELPKEFRDKLVREMKKVVESGPNPRYKMTVKDFAQEADWQLVHLQLLSQSGILVSEGNVFKSSKFGGPDNWTPWQNELHQDVEKQELDLVNKITARHPAAKKAAQSVIKKLQAQRFESTSTEDWRTFNQSVYNYLTKDLIKKVSK